MPVQGEIPSCEGLRARQMLLNASQSRGTVLDAFDPTIAFDIFLYKIMV